MVYKLEDLRAYGYRLHFNTALTLFFNSLAGYLIIRYSKPVMGNYKYYILSTVIFTFFMDFHMTFIFGLFPLYPFPGGCPAGISKYFGHYWGTAIQFGIFHFTLTFCGLSVFSCIIYQYLSLNSNNHFLQTFRGAMYGIGFMLIYPLPSLILYFMNYNYTEFLEQLKNYDPKFIEFFIAASCDGHIIIKSAFLYLCVCSFQILLINISASVMVIKIVKILLKKKCQMSRATLKMRQQYFRVLIIQFLLPMIFLVIPLLFMVALVLLNVKNIDAYTQISYQFMSLHSTANALTIMIFIKSYRSTLHYWFTTVFRSCKKVDVHSKSNSIIVLNIK